MHPSCILSGGQWLWSPFIFTHKQKHTHFFFLSSKLLHRFCMKCVAAAANTVNIRGVWPICTFSFSWTQHIKPKSLDLTILVCFIWTISKSPAHLWTRRNERNKIKTTSHENNHKQTVIQISFGFFLLLLSILCLLFHVWTNFDDPTLNHVMSQSSCELLFVELYEKKMKKKLGTNYVIKIATKNHLNHIHYIQFAILFECGTSI